MGGGACEGRRSDSRQCRRSCGRTARSVRRKVGLAIRGSGTSDRANRGRRRRLGVRRNPDPQYRPQCRRRPAPEEYGIEPTSFRRDAAQLLGRPRASPGPAPERPDVIHIDLELLPDARDLVGEEDVGGRRQLVDDLDAGGGRQPGSILMTSAPQSARSADAEGTNVCSTTSNTRTPVITAVIGSLLVPLVD